MRFSWASRRLTTVEEDETYSLLGLFGISLPLIYGEGRWRAFNRLQRELITVYNDDSIFAWKFEPSSSANWHAKNGPQQQKGEDLTSPCAMMQMQPPKSHDMLTPFTAANEHGRGILAPSIREYWDASSIEAFSFDNSFSMTNKGLEINAQRWRRKDDTNRCLIRLNCGLGAFKRLAIPLLEHVDGTYGRIKLDEIYDMTMIRPHEWKEVPSKGPAVIRASNYSNVLTSPSIFTLDYPDQTNVGNSFSRPELTPRELIVEPNRLVFINIESRSGGASRFLLDVIINLDERSFLPSGSWHEVATDPAYPAIAVDEDGGAVVSVVLLPQPRKRRPMQGGASEANAPTSREYVLKIRVQQDGDHDRPTPAPFLKRRRTEY
ncbi:HET domain-containing protein [Apiospora phragmitis]|uniref:HET domain-containing protein n=1 Tax=Apiospora phragmitis TaxID=2905665 RepID=A0ABR1VF31_9PEZI